MNDERNPLYIGAANGLDLSRGPDTRSDPCARGRARTTPGFVNHPEAVATSHYVGVLAPGNVPLRDRINEILKQAMKDGRLEAIFRKWNVSDEYATRVLTIEEGRVVEGGESGNWNLKTRI